MRCDNLACCGLLSHLPPRFPLLFHGLVGKDEREGNSPSWFNSMEVLQVGRVQYCTFVSLVLPNEATADKPRDNLGRL
jgi:hypothetical protein